MKKKNLLYIFADQWRYSARGCKNKILDTPNFDAFTNDNFEFNNAISTYPLCSPHRAALWTGKYPLSCGFWTNCKYGLPISPTLSPQEVTLSDVLYQNGYNTAYIGKWHLDSSEKNYKKNPESDAEDWDAFTPKGERRHNFKFWHSYGTMNNHTNPHYWEDNPKKIYPKKWEAEHNVDILLEFLTRTKESPNPFFSVVSWNPPHPPYDLVPQKFKDMISIDEIEFKENVPKEVRNNFELIRNLRDYYAAVIGLDEQFGRIIHYLKENNLYEDTTIVLSSDHGDCLGSHKIYGKNVWYEESIHIPLCIHDRDLKQGTSDVLIESCDHMPTLLDLLNIGIPETVEGKSAIKVINKLEPEKESAFICMLPGMPDSIEKAKTQKDEIISFGSDASIKNFSDLGLNSSCYGWRGIRTKTHTYVIDNGNQPNNKQIRYLYNNSKDPLQLNPEILDRKDDKCKYYDKLLKEYFANQQDVFLL